jgi:hypothetical protein
VKHTLTSLRHNVARKKMVTNDGRKKKDKGKDERVKVINKKYKKNKRKKKKIKFNYFIILNYIKVKNKN